jgi:pimeloyl-ACP methyl ester carboxylesterase
MAIARLLDTQIHYQQLGTVTDGNHTDFVLIHGFAATLGTWYFTIAPALSCYGRVTMLDLRGHGRSSMPSNGYFLSDFVSDLDQLLTSLGIQQAHFLGHSLGGAIAIAFSQTYPDRISSLTIVDSRIKPLQPVISLDDLNISSRQRQLLDTELNIQLDDTCPETSYDLLIKLVSARLQLPDSAFSQLLETQAFAGLATATKLGTKAGRKILDLTSQTSILRDLHDDSSLSLDSLRQITIPTLAVYGQLSHTLMSAFGLEKIWPHLQLRLIPEVGHFFPISKPMALIEPFLEFLEDHIHLNPGETLRSIPVDCTGA